MATPGGPKRLSQLALGERVLAVDPFTGRLQFSPVYMWSSRRPNQAAQYVTVRTDAGLNITGAGLSEYKLLPHVMRTAWPVLMHLQRERVLGGQSLLPTTYMPTLRCALV